MRMNIRKGREPGNEARFLQCTGFVPCEGCTYVLIRLHRATSNLHSGTWDMYPMAVPLNTHASIAQVYIILT